MKNILNSKINCIDDNINEFSDIIIEFLQNSEYIKLNNFYQHINISRLTHSINVAYITYILCKKFKLNYISATKGAMLHDFFLYDWKQKNESPLKHSLNHPKFALKNSKKIFAVDKIMEDCILNHMWPLGKFPKTNEGRIVQLADKYSTTYEVIIQFSKIIKTMFIMKSIK